MVCGHRGIPYSEFFRPGEMEVSPMLTSKSLLLATASAFHSTTPWMDDPWSILPKCSSRTTGNSRRATKLCQVFVNEVFVNEEGNPGRLEFLSRLGKLELIQLRAT